MRNSCKAGGTVKKKMETGGGIGNTSIRRMRINNLNNRSNKVASKQLAEIRSSSPNQNKVDRLNNKMNRLDDRQMRLIQKDYKSMKKGGAVKKKMASGGAVIASPIQTRLGNKPVAGGNMAKGGALKTVNPAANPGLAQLPTPVRNKMGYAKKGGAHPGFKAVQAKIAAKSGVSKKAAGAILAASTRKASAKAKAANPRLKRVKG